MLPSRARQARCNSISNKTRSLPRRCNPPSVYDEINIARAADGALAIMMIDISLPRERFFSRCGVCASIFHAALMQRVKPERIKIFFRNLQNDTRPVALIICFPYTSILPVDFSKYRTP